jgi:hypothetical protein
MRTGPHERTEAKGAGELIRTAAAIVQASTDQKIGQRGERAGIGRDGLTHVALLFRITTLATSISS